MTTKKRFFSIFLMLTLFLVSCTTSTQSFETDDGYLSLKYPNEMSFAKDQSTQSEIYSFFYDDENFVILATEDVSSLDANLLNSQTLVNNAKIFSEPFTSQGFNLVSEENMTIGNNQAYKITYSDEAYTLVYIQWFETEELPEKLYKIMCVYDTDHKDEIEKVLDSIKIN